MAAVPTTRLTDPTSPPHPSDPTAAAARLPRRLAVAVARRRTRRRDCSAAAGFVAVDETAPWADVPDAGYVVARRRAGRLAPAGRAPVPCRCASSAPTPTPPTCASSRTPTSAAPAGASSASRSTAACCSTAGSTATSASPGGSSPPTARRRSSPSHEPIARVPQLAIHLDRDVNERGVVLDRQAHMSPVWATALGHRRSRDGSPSAPAAPCRRRGSSGCSTSSRPPCSAPTARCWPAGASTTRCRAGRRRPRWPPPQPADHVAMIALFDHEEVGSASTTGASGPILETIIERLNVAAGGSRDDLHRTLAASSCVSADNAHAVHPNYAERHDPDHAPLVNQRPGDQAQRQPALRHVGRHGGAVPAGVRDGRRAAPGVRVAQQRAVRLDDRPAHRDPPRHRHRRRRRAAAVDALGPRAVRRPTDPAVAGAAGADRLPRRARRDARLTSASLASVALRRVRLRHERSDRSRRRVRRRQPLQRRRAARR